MYGSPVLPAKPERLLWRNGGTAYHEQGDLPSDGLGMTAMNYLDRLLNPVSEAFTPELARKIVEIRADAELEGQINSLRRKANDGTITPEEDADYKEFVEAVDLLSIFQAKARRFLSQHPG
jgi:hypothetical protein